LVAILIYALVSQTQKENEKSEVMKVNRSVPKSGEKFRMRK